MFNVGTGELVLIMVLALLVLGPKRLPELARGIGRFFRELRRQTEEVRGVVEREFYQMDREIESPLPQETKKPESPLSLAPPAEAVPLDPGLAATAVLAPTPAPLGPGPSTPPVPSEAEGERRAGSPGEAEEQASGKAP